jgi:Fanconi anemia group J protein
MLKATELTISGCKVKFPAKPYRSQVAMMSKIITSIQRSQNSLLESPTGSGKSLALLCASLAWQETEQARVDAFNTLLAQATETQDPTIRDTLMAMVGPDAEMEEEFFYPGNNPADDTVVQPHQEDTGGGFFTADPEMDDFVDPDSTKRKKPGGPPKEDSTAYHLPGGGEIHAAAAGPARLRLPKKQTVPKIYFGTRTHKQVAQIVRELKKTGYSRTRMTVLASREHTCIHPTVSRSFQKNTDCQELMDKNKGGGCRYQHNVKTKLTSYHSLRHQLGHEEAWDLEEIVKVGRKGKWCPYFGVRELRTSAQLIICPYNYLVDPKIRKSMEINLTNQVLVLDEAHNIEDSARL